MPKKGVVLPPGASGGSDAVHTFTPSILYKDGFFWLYYTGYDGSAFRICLALSKDGINFTKKGVVLPLGASGESDDFYAYYPSILYKDGFFWLYYAGHDGSADRICLALSKDGINFTKKGVVLPLGASGESDDVFTYEMSILYKDGFFWLYYTGNDGSADRICLALSKDGINFTKKGVVLPLGASGESDDVYTHYPSILYKDGFFWLYYAGHDGSNWRICLALSKDGINFTKKGVVLPLGASGGSDDARAYYPSILYKDGFFWLYYAGHDGSADRICLALSKDGINFTG